MTSAHRLDSAGTRAIEDEFLGRQQRWHHDGPHAIATEPR